MAGREGMTGGRRVRWQLLEVVGQEGGGKKGQIAWVGQEADGREPDGAGTVGQGGPEGQEGGDDRVHESQMVVAGGIGSGMGQEFKMGGRQGPDQGVKEVRG